MVKDFGSLTINVIRFLFQYFARSAFAGIVINCCWIAIYNYHYWFTWHVLFCTFGYIPLMAEAFMLFTGDDIWCQQIDRKTKYAVHGVLITVGTLMTIIGNSIIIHYTESGFHFYTVHGITGLVSMILLIVSLGLGVAVNYSDIARKYIRLTPVWYKFLHNFIGIFAYGVGIASLCYAYYTNWFVYYTTHESRVIAVVVTILFSIWSVNGAIISLYNQTKSLFFSK